MVNVKVDGEIIENVKIKYFNSKILELDDYELKLVLKSYSYEYLSIYGFRIRTFLFKSPEIEEICKKYLFNLISSNIIKEGFQKFDKRFDHYKQKYPFEGKYKNEIFEEIWNNIIVIPFIYDNTCSKTDRTNYKIYLDSTPYKEKNSDKAINIIFSKLNDLYHELFHIIAILYAVNMNEYENDKYSTSDSIEENTSNEIKIIINKYGNKYPNEMKIMQYELTDMGDIMEIYFFGIKPKETSLYVAIFLSYILDNNEMKNFSIDDVRTELLGLCSSNEEIDSKELKEYHSNNSHDSDKKKKIYKYFKSSVIFDLCRDSFSEMKTIKNIKYRRRYIDNGNNIITNIIYSHPRNHCYCRRNKRNRK